MSEASILIINIAWYLLYRKESKSHDELKAEFDMILAENKHIQAEVEACRKSIANNESNKK